MLVGAMSADIGVIAIGSTATRIARSIGRHPGFSCEIKHLDPSVAHVDERQIADLSAFGPATDAILVLAATSASGAVAQLITAISDLRESGGRVRVWPAFVEGDASSLADLDDALDGLPGAACDAVLVLTSVPSASSAAAALSAWLTVKIPAPAGVLGQLPDVSGRTCRYVALGMETVDAQSLADIDTSASPAPTRAAGLEHGSLLAELIDRLDAAFGAAEAVVDLRQRRDRLQEAIKNGDAAQVLACERELVGLGSADPEPWLHQLVDSVVAESADTIDQLADGGENPPARQGAGPAEGGTTADPTRLAGAVTEYVLVNGKTGLGRLMARARRRAAATALDAAAYEFAHQAERVWSAAGAMLVQRAAQKAAARAASVRMRSLSDAQARDSAAATSRLRAEVEEAVTTVGVWQAVNADGIERTWGLGAPAPRRYVIGSAELLEPVIDLTEDSGPCLRVVSANNDKSVAVLVVQYGLPLSALR